MVASGWGEGEMNKRNTEDFSGSETTLHDTVMVHKCHIHLSKPIEYTVPRVTPKVNYRLWVIMLCQRRLINCNKSITLVGDVR